MFCKFPEQLQKPTHVHAATHVKRKKKNKLLLGFVLFQAHYKTGFCSACRDKKWLNSNQWTYSSQLSFFPSKSLLHHPKTASIAILYKSIPLNYMGVSKNRGTPNWMVYNGKPHLKWMIWGYHHLRKHPYLEKPWNLRFPGCHLFRAQPGPSVLQCLCFSSEETPGRSLWQNNQCCWPCSWRYGFPPFAWQRPWYVCLSFRLLCHTKNAKKKDPFIETYWNNWLLLDLFGMFD